MTSLLAAAAVALIAASGLAAAALHRSPRVAQRAACLALCAGAALGLAAAVAALRGGAGAARIPGIGVDALSAVFLLPISLVGALGAVYGLRYDPQEERGARAIRVQLFYGLAVAGMVLLVVATQAIAFLVGWEVMALANFLLIQTEHEDPEVRRSAFLYLAATHAATLALFAVFALLARAAGSFDFAAMRGLTAAGPLGTPLLVLALIGFGTKAGLMPLHFWLPPAHAAAPSHVSALMSGVVVKTGLYGLLRVTGLLDAIPVSWGVALLALGAVSAVLGVAFALAQHDLKRLLAYHTVENVGIIALGAGLALVGRARGDLALVALGFGGAALHVVNHAAFKSLLFLGAGAVQHGTGTRALDRLGGLLRRMPATGLLFLVGAAAISGLPPLNGFVSEWLVYLGFLETLGRPPGDLLAFAAVGMPVLALVGGLAAACFVKVVGVVFLGEPRTEGARAAHEAPRAMVAPMAVLAAACAVIGLAPGAVLTPLRNAAAAWARVDPALLEEATARAASGAARVSLAAALLLLAAAGLALLRRRRLAAHPAPAAVATWGCGFAAPTPRIQYTGSSFAALLVSRFGWVVRPRVHGTPPTGTFPAAAAFHADVPDAVLDVVLLPAARAYRWAATQVRGLYRRRVQFQILLILATLLAALAWGFVW